MKEKHVYLLVYVDDILIIGKNDKEITEAKTILAKLYGVKDMGIAQYFLGVGVHRVQDGGISLSQQSYITRMCDKFYLTDAKPVTSPVDAGQMSKLRSKEPATAEEFINVIKDMLADILTKPLSGQELKRQRERLGLYPAQEKKE
jgi:Reverse transcriptase (RNA-dependent DNA polymerase)